MMRLIDWVAIAALGIAPAALENKSFQMPSLRGFIILRDCVETLTFPT
jgi:hypothetical protein